MSISLRSVLDNRLCESYGGRAKCANAFEAKTLEKYDVWQAGSQPVIVNETA
jgi:hypothetical protein